MSKVTVAAALALMYHLSENRGFKVGIEIRQNDTVLYDETALSRAVESNTHSYPD